ncbi:helix-turn-helix domain-containing protein [Comamonas thiooxydans]|uniref:helix-turn-helix domain-containing protein n=1 Tax=Comamonas thiooxydans TaxID=363952 RepID=UPI00050D9786|nr:hypothetical protein P609_15025 [Comamonas thiooxydans]
MGPISRPRTFAELLFDIRQQKGVSQAAASQLIGISNGYLSELENNKRSVPTQKTIEKIATGLGLTKAQKDELTALANAERFALDIPQHVSHEAKDLLICFHRCAPHLDHQTLLSIRDSLRKATPLAW